MPKSRPLRCPKCESTDLASIASAAVDTDSELLECQDCKAAYEVKYEGDRAPRLVSVCSDSRQWDHSVELPTPDTVNASTEAPRT